MLEKPFLCIILVLALTYADNTTCPTEATRRNTLQCFTYPRSTCVENLAVYSTNTSLYIGNSTRSNLETEITVFRILNQLLANLTGYTEDCENFYQTLACLYLYTPCFEGRPLRFCDASCLSIKQSQCTISSYFFNLAFNMLGDTVFRELHFGDCESLNDRVDGYPEIPTEDYSTALNCTYVGLPGALNGNEIKNGIVKLVTDQTHDSSNIYATSSHGVVQVLNAQANIWGDVCIEEGTTTEELDRISMVVCNSIDYPGGYRDHDVGEPSTSSGYYMINKLSCNGNESQLFDCQHNGYDFKFCSMNRRLHVTCDKEVGTIKFADMVKDDHSISGVPMVQLDGGQVAEFCADTFTDNTGIVICRSLNTSYPNLTVTYSSEFEEEDYKLATFNCMGNEVRIFQCDEANTTCVSGRRVMITCNDNIQTNATLVIQLTTTEIIILVSSSIILVLLVTIVTVICLFCRYRTTTNRKIQLSQWNGSRSDVMLMNTISAQSGTGTLHTKLTQNPSFISNAVVPIMEHNFNQQIYGIDNHNVNLVIHAAQDPSPTSPVSPIQNYMVTTLGAGSLPISDEKLSIAFLQEYCGRDIIEYIIPTSRLKMGSTLGQGAFGIVYKGSILDRTEQQMDQVEPRDEVAVKTLKNSYTDNELKDLLIECALLKDLQHPNILGLLAVACDGKRPFAIIPYMENGDLKAYLKNVREKALNSLELPKELSGNLLVKMSLDIAKGMEYITSKRYVHRDLAARNCMVDGDLNVKVSDFGLSRELYVDDYYRQTGTKLPAKWMSPECLGDNICNEATDVWSFGVTLWEVYSLGRNPYPGVGNSEMLKFLEQGKRMEKPRMCPDEIYELMQYCWQFIPNNRPTFVIVRHYFESLKMSEVSCEISGSHRVTCNAIQEEEEKLHQIELNEKESEANRKILHRQDAVILQINTPFTPIKAVCFEHLASRFEESTKKAFIMQCMKSVSMDSSKFTPADHYIIPYLSMSIPIIDEQHRERTRSLNTVRKKTIKQAEKKQRHTALGLKGITEEGLEKLRVPPRGKKNTSAPQRGKPAHRHDGRSLFSKST